MKFVLGLISIAMFSGCGLQNQINDLKDRSNHNESNISDLQRRVAVLELDRTSLQSQLNLLGQTVLQGDESLQSQIDVINTQVATLVASGTATQEQVNSLSTALEQALLDAAALSGRVSSVEGDTTTLTLSVNDLNTSLLDLSNYVDTMVNAAGTQFVLVGNALTNLENNATSVNASLDGLTSSVTVLQSQYASTLVQLATLQGYTNIVSIKDVCGKQGAFDEIFLKLSTGKYLASFSDTVSGSNTRFSVLADGNNFTTTDGTHCLFSVKDDGTTIFNEHN